MCEADSGSSIENFVRLSGWQSNMPSSTQGPPLNLDEVQREKEERRQREAEAQERLRIEQAICAFELVTPGQSLWICPCGTVVADREKHVHWHDSLNDTAQKADDSFFLNTPLGG